MSIATASELTLEESQEPNPERTDGENSGLPGPKGEHQRRGLASADSYRQRMRSRAVELAESCTSGIFVDYLKRAELSGLDSRSSSQRLINAAFGRSPLQKTPDITYARQQVVRDQLEHHLMSGIVSESKRRGVYPHLTIDTLKKHTDMIVSQKKMTLLLKIEVKHWLSQRRALGEVHKRSSETFLERRARMDEFWDLFHDKDRDSKAQAKKDEQEFRKSLPAPMFSPTPGQTQGEGQTRRKLDRQPSSHQKFGMRCDPISGVSQWRAIEPQPASLAFLRQQRDRRVETRESVGNTILGGKACSLPNLHRPKTSHAAAQRPTGRDRAWPGSAKQKGKPNQGGYALECGNSVEEQEHCELVLPSIMAGRLRYMRDCEETLTVPTPLPFLTGHSVKFDVAGYDIVDKELVSMSAMLKERARVDEINLENSKLLTDRGLIPFLSVLLQNDMAENVTVLNLAGCTHAASGTLKKAIHLIQMAKGLSQLDLSGIFISTAVQLQLCECVGRHASLRRVNLSETGLGGSHMTNTSIVHLLSCTTLEILDLSWNVFSYEAFLILGEKVVESNRLKQLRVVNCAGSATITPINWFLEKLAFDSKLEHLDIAMNRVDFRSALIIEDSFTSHSKLHDMNISQNPLGTLGMRSMLRLLSQSSSGLLYFNSEGCYTGAPTDDDERGFQHFCYTSPGGMYRLDLTSPYHRSLLRMLYKTMERFQLTPDSAFSIKSYTHGSFNHGQKGSSGVWEVPREGNVELFFDVESAMSTALSKIEDKDNAGFLRRWRQLMRCTLDWKKVTPLLGIWSQLDEASMNVFVTALASDFGLRPSTLEFLALGCRVALVDTLTKLVPIVTFDLASRCHVLRVPPSLPEFVTVYQNLHALLKFNVVNPTGHYKLNLSSAGERAVAELIILLDRWESVVDKRLGRMDTSQRGNRCHLRNETYQQRSLHFRIFSVAEWILPEQGIFEFDYVSRQRPSSTDAVLSDDLWERLLVDMFYSTASQEDKLATLRAISHTFYIRAMHMRQLVGFFREPSHREEAFVTLYMRIVDMANDKCFRVRFTSQEEIDKLQSRLGFAAYFPFLQPENAKFCLNLKEYEQRLCASMFVQLNNRENDNNIRSPLFRLPDMTIDSNTLAIGVPRSWENFDRLPREGHFEGYYMCAPEHRKFETRKTLASTYGYLDVENLQAEDIDWVTGLSDVPPDVLDLLEFFIGRVSDMEEAFRLIDGDGGNGVINRAEFEEGIQKLGCKKFNGSDEKARLMKIFKFLDPGDEGTISKAEWGVLDQLWSEYKLSISEFVQFLVFCFGDDLQEAWEELDRDGSGSLTLTEWLEAVEHVGYFGPAKLVFSLLDTTDDMEISFAEFEVLNNYKPKRRSA